MSEKTTAAQTECREGRGLLPDCAPLATAYTPMQPAAQPRYPAEKAMARGTLFPGLDLPFRELVNSAAPDVPTAELMALDFVLNELSLYLDTHSEDAEAFAMYQKCLHLAEEGRKKYAALYGPFTKGEMQNAASYTWLKEPWPWDFTGTEEG